MQVSIRARNACRRVLHWGANEWNRPDESYWPAGTVPQDAKAVQSPFVDGTTVSLTIPEAVCPNTIVFVLKELEPENWVNCGGQHFTIVIRQPSASAIADKVQEQERGGGGKEESRVQCQPRSSSIRMGMLVGQGLRAALLDRAPPFFVDHVFTPLNSHHPVTPPLSLPPYPLQVVNAEATYTNWSLFNRLCLLLEVLDASKLAGESREREEQWFYSPGPLGLRRLIRFMRAEGGRRHSPNEKAAYPTPLDTL
jgi:hypothetical protein